jgi:hypothetical protein
MANSFYFAHRIGRKVIFYSRNRKAKTVIWHPRFFFWYRTTVDALKAKAHWEEKHRILFPEDIKHEKATPEKSKPRKSAHQCQQPEGDLFEARV